MHQSCVMAAKHDGMAVFGSPLAQFMGHLEKNWVNILIGRTENT
jgi:hypothetical protein